MTRRLSESAIVDDLAKHLCQRITRSTIRGLQSMDRGLSPDDSGLQNVWDEICVQVQYQESIYWDAYDEAVRAFVAAAVEELQPFEQEAIWLQTPQAFDWRWDDEAEQERYPVVIDDIVAYIVSEFVLGEAGRWSNTRIRAYLERAYQRD